MKRLVILFLLLTVNLAHAGAIDFRISDDDGDVLNINPDGTVPVSGGTGGWQDTGVIVSLTTSSDKVGIGTDAPTQALTVNGSINTSGSEERISGSLGPYIDFDDAGSNDILLSSSSTALQVSIQSSSGKVLVLENNDTDGLISVTGGFLKLQDLVVFTNQTTTIADNASGGSQATQTITPTNSHTNVTCNDADGCAITMGETNMTQGAFFVITNVGTNRINFSNTANVTALRGNVELKQHNSLLLWYSTSQWYEVGRVVSTRTTQTIAAGNTISADSCGGIKAINAGGAVTTDTTNTFSAPSGSSQLSNCCMDVVNVDDTDAITLDNNALFKSAGGADVVLGAGDTVRVCTDATTWYQIGATGNN